MSKMTKTQVNHLENRLSMSLKRAIDTKFPVPKPPKAYDNEDLDKINSEISKATGYDLMEATSYHARHVLIALYQKSQGRSEYEKALSKQREEINEYRKAKEVEINEILDCAILGDSTEALEALKKFQEKL